MSRFRHPNAGAAAGFTLLEVLVALAIVAIALGALVAASGNQARNSVYLRDKALAHWVAMNRIAELQVQNTVVPLGRDSGHANMAQREWTWRTDISATEDPNVHRVEVEVTDATEDDVLARLTGFVYQGQAANP